MMLLKKLKTLEILEKPETIFNRRLSVNQFYPFEDLKRNSKSRTHDSMRVQCFLFCCVVFCFVVLCLRFVVVFCCVVSCRVSNVLSYFCFIVMLCMFISFMPNIVYVMLCCVYVLLSCSVLLSCRVSNVFFCCVVICSVLLHSYVVCVYQFYAQYYLYQLPAQSA